MVAGQLMRVFLPFFFLTCFSSSVADPPAVGKRVISPCCFVLCLHPFYGGVVGMINVACLWDGLPFTIMLLKCTTCLGYLLSWISSGTLILESDDRIFCSFCGTFRISLLVIMVVVCSWFVLAIWAF